MPATATIELSRDEALVLFDFLQREMEAARDARLAAIAEHEAELWALNGLSCLLEREIGEAFSPDYPAFVAAARAALVATCGTWPEAATTPRRS